jgi:hypothetical protein
MDSVADATAVLLEAEGKNIPDTSGHSDAVNSAL